MQLVSPIDPFVSRPVRIVNGEGSLGTLLGGRPPIGVAPAGETGHLRYFATVPLTEEPMQLVSIFLADLESLMAVRGRVNPNGLLELVVHAPVQRGSGSSALDSGLSAHGLSVLASASDLVIDDDGTQVIRPGHKVGGRPHLLRASSQLSRALDDLWNA